MSGPTPSRQSDGTHVFSMSVSEFDSFVRRTEGLDVIDVAVGYAERGYVHTSLDERAAIEARQFINELKRRNFADRTKL